MASGRDSGSSGGSGTQQLLMWIGLSGGTVGCLLSPLIILLLIAATLIVCAIGFFFWPLVLLCDIFNFCGTDHGGSGARDEVSMVMNGDGREELYSTSVPSDLATTIREAGAECTQIGPVVIAAQIQLESGWNRTLVGDDGEEGISQLPPDKFEEFGEDEDDNDKTSAMDPEDSIMAQGRYMCSLSKDVGTQLDAGAIEGDPLDLTLAAYNIGFETIEQAGGLPEGTEGASAKGYVTAIRASFPYYAGTLAKDGEDYPSMTSPPWPSGARKPES
ncbi:transglycosylase SLT domain-containing protein [Streptomyces sp. NPDC048376]|uniref:transglycosylase SLT domain-containing protein n=2 Tax=unclassified Streptomyces TaxID=2593676 RepID=UPI00342D5079